MIAKLIREVAKKYPWQIISIILLSGIVAILDGLGIGFTLPIIDALASDGLIHPSNPFSQAIVDLLTNLKIQPTLPAILILGLIIFIGQTLLKLQKQIISNKVSYAYMTHLRKRIFSNLVHSELSFFDDHQIGDVSNSLVTETQRASNAFANLMQLVATIGLLLIYLGVGLVLSWQTSLIAMILIFMITIVLQPRIRLAATRGGQVSKLNSSIQSIIYDKLGGIRIVKLFGMEKKEYESVSEKADEVSNTLVLLGIGAGLVSAIFNIALISVTLFLVFIGITYFGMSRAVMVTFLVVLFRLQPAVEQLNTSRHRIAEYLPGYIAVRKLLLETGLKLEKTPPTAVKSPSVLRSIRFDAVSFGYTKSKQIIKEIDLEAHAGEITAIVGTSGAGKSTIVDLIGRLYRPSQGCILANEVDIENIDLENWRSNIATVGQEAYLFNGSILNNIRYGKPSASFEDVEYAAKSANAYGFIMSLEEGFQSTVGDRGTLLSGGQIQRLTLARALLRNPQILILDEATSNLDSKSENLIQDAISHERNDRIVLIIAHRLSTIKDADIIYVLEEGEIIEKGSHSELVKLNGKYMEFLMAQSK